MTIVTHSLNGSTFLQLAHNEIISGKLVPAGYVNLTQLCQLENKRLSNYSQLAKTKSFLQELSDDTVIPVSQLVIVINARGDSGLQGSWGHPLVAVNLCSWISPKFEVKATKVILAVINGDFKALTPEAEEAKRHLQELWEKMRRAGMGTRRGITNSIQDWYQRNPGVTSRPEHVMYAVVTNRIYQALWGMDAKEIEVFLGCGRHECRDFMTAECLKVLERAESLVMDLIDEHNIKPVHAVAIAGIRKSRHPLARREF